MGLKVPPIGGGGLVDDGLGPGVGLVGLLHPRRIALPDRNGALHQQAKHLGAVLSGPVSRLIGVALRKLSFALLRCPRLHVLGRLLPDDQLVGLGAGPAHDHQEGFADRLGREKE